MIVRPVSEIFAFCFYSSNVHELIAVYSTNRVLLSRQAGALSARVVSGQAKSLKLRVGTVSNIQHPLDLVNKVEEILMSFNQLYRKVEMNS